MAKKPIIAIVGAGIGGLTAAASLIRLGFKIEPMSKRNGSRRSAPGYNLLQMQ